ncbi:MAG: hypothetical protein JO055_08340 [Alphaproteobacteria bacterium]|nr:hypothetical protein [Alphaproteobacteria bacterium]
MPLGPALSSDRQAFGLPSIISEQDARWSEWRTRYREIGPEDLRAAGAGPIEAATWAVPLNYAMKKFEIFNTARQAAFLANVALETADPDTGRMLSAPIESSAPYTVRMMRSKTKSFPDDASIIAVLHDPLNINHPDKVRVVEPKKFFNRFYGWRSELGNRGRDTNDGYMYRGRGALHLTGRARYVACGIALGLDLVGNPDIVANPFYGSLAGAWAWTDVAFLQHGRGAKQMKNLNLIADLDTAEAFDQTCAGVNYGDIDGISPDGNHVHIGGLDKRRHNWQKFRHALHLRDLRLFHTRMAGVPARANLFDDFKRPTANDDGMRSRFQRARAVSR